MKYALFVLLMSIISNIGAQTVPTTYPKNGFIDETGGSGESAGLAIKKAMPSDQCEALDNEPLGLIVWHDGTGKSHGCITEEDARHFYNYCHKGIVSKTAAKSSLIKRFGEIPKNPCKHFAKEDATKVNSSARSAAKSVKKASGSSSTATTSTIKND